MILYFECTSGISGDMTLGALIDLLDCKEYFLEELSKLGLNHEFDIQISKQEKSGERGTRVCVTPHHLHNHRNLAGIVKIIEDSLLNENVKELSKKTFLFLAQAEATVHKTAIEDVHFHEVGAVDAIVDICGTAILIDLLKPNEIICSPINTGSGNVLCAHGFMKVPAPATAELLKGLPIYAAGDKGELTTPTGAAIIKSLAKMYDYSDVDGYHFGVGIGKMDIDSQPNVLKVFSDEKR
ncbi:MAG: LarC family nickel insertion protein [Christensenellaceae bacterium]